MTRVTCRTGVHALPFLTDAVETVGAQLELLAQAPQQSLAARPIAEKLAMLDALRERALALRPARPASERDVLREQPPSYRGQGENTE